MFGAHDFIEYWTAYRLFAAGQNPYDPDLLLTLQRTLGWTEPVPLMMWNPPWLLALFAPILKLPFEASAAAWLALGIAALGLASWLVLSLPGPALSRRAFALSFFSLFAFFPAVECLRMGQVSAFLTFAVALLWWGLAKSKNWAVGAAAALLTLKIHLAFLPLILAAWWTLRERRWSVPFWFAGICSAFVLLTTAIEPSALEHWTASLGADASTHHLIGVAQWRVATLVGFVREIISSADGLAPVWPLVVIPGISAVVFFAYLILRHPEPAGVFAPALLLSLALAPYGWLFDFALLGLVQVQIFRESLAKQPPEAIPPLLFLALQATTALLTGRVLTMHHQFFWFPVAMLVLFWITRREKKTVTNGADLREE